MNSVACPHIKHQDWIYAEEYFGRNKTIILYDQLGQRLPSKAEVDLIRAGGKLSPNHNQRVWDVRKTEKLNSGRWHTEIGNEGLPIKTVDPILMHKAKAQERVDRYNNHWPKYTKDGFTFTVGYRKQSNARGGEYFVDVIDKRFVPDYDLYDEHTRNEVEREIMREEGNAEWAETQSVPFKGTGVGYVQEQRSPMSIYLSKTNYDNVEGLKYQDEYVSRDRDWDMLRGKSFYSPFENIYIDATNFQEFLDKKQDHYDHITSGGTHYYFEWLTDIADRGELFSFGVKFTESKGGVLVEYDPDTKLRGTFTKEHRPLLSEENHFNSIYNGVKKLYNSVGNIDINIPELKYKGTAAKFLGINEESKSLLGIQTEAETYPGLQAKIDILRKSIPSVENIILDETLTSVAQVDKDGKTIRINPRLMTTDSIGHEFGHILIDLLGGMSNSMIRQGREQLKGTDVERAVMEAYPELVLLGDDRIDKEILTTAVGLKAAELFKDLDIQNKWMRWLVRFFRRLRAMLGIESSVVLKLATKLVSGTELATRETATTKEIEEGMYVQGEASRYIQYSKTLGETTTLLDTMIEKEQEFQNKAAVLLQKKLDVYAKKGRSSAEYKRLEETLPRIQGTNPTRGLIHMLRFAVDATKDMNDKYLSYLKAERYPKENESKVFTVKLLSEWRTSVAAWDMLGDLRQLYDSTRKQVELFGEESDKKTLKALLVDNKPILQVILGEDEYKKLTANKNTNILDLLIPLLDQAIAVKDDIQKLYIEKGKELIVDFLLPYTSHVKVFRRDKYEREWLNLPKEEQAEISKEKYITKMMSEHMDEIEQDTRDLILRELQKADGDVGFLTRYLDTILDSRDVISSALARSIYTIQEKSSREIVDWKYKFVDNVRRLEKQLGRTPSMPDEVFWEWMYEEDHETGTPMRNIISALPSKLIDDYWKYYETVSSDNYIDNDGNKPSFEQKGRMLRKWKEENAPRDRKAWLAAQAEFAEELHEKKLITAKELKNFISNTKITYSASRRPIEKLFHDAEAVNLVKSFQDRNEWTFREPSGYYKKLNTKWDALVAMRKNGLKNGVQTDERVLFYDFITEVIDQAAARLPGKYALTTELPSMRKGLGQRYRASAKYDISTLDFLTQEIKDKLRKSSTDTDRGMLDEDDSALNIVGKEQREEALKEGVVEGKEKTELVNEANEPVYFLPIYYTQNKTTDVSRKLPVEEQSFDIASLYFNYLKMAIDFGNKYDILSEIEMTNYFIQNREVIRRDESTGGILVDAVRKKMRNVSDNVRDRALTKSGHKSMVAAQTEDFVKALIYGMQKDEEPDISIFGLKVDQAKFLDAINSFTAINLLGVNFIAGLANVNLGEITQINEAFAGQYTTLKDLRNATGYYYKNLGGILLDIGTRRPANIVSLLIDRFNVLNEEIDGRINLNSKFANLMKTNTVFFTSHAGEHYMQTRFMLSMLMTLKAKDSEGNVLGRMLDYISVDESTGTLKIDERVANFTEEDQTNFSIKMHRVLTAMHGEYSQMGQTSIQRKAIGRMGLLFRKFAVPGFKRRWQKGRRQAVAWAKQGIMPDYTGINNLLEEYTEGYYRTFGRLAKQYFMDLLHLKYEAMEAYGRTGKYKMTDAEIANMRRMIGEVASLMVTWVIINLIVRAKADDDDKDNLALNHLAYQAYRLRSEISFFINPMATMQILRSPMASMSMIESSLKLVGQIMYPLMSGEFRFQEYEQGSWKGHLKLEKTINNLIPISKQYRRIFDIGDMVSWFKF